MMGMMQAMTLTMVEILCCKIFSEAFLNKRFLQKKVINFMLIVAFVLITSIIALLSVKNYIIAPIMAIGVIMLFVGSYFKASPMQVIFCSVAFYGILIAIDKIVLWAIPILVPSEYKEILDQPLKVTILALLCKAILFLCVISLNRKFKKESSFQLISEMEWSKFLFFPIFTIMSMLFMVVSDKSHEQTLVFVSFGLIVGNFFVFYMINGIVFRERKLREIKIAQERTQNQTNMYYQKIGHYEEQKNKIHEFKNHIGCVQGLLEANESKKALYYIASVNQSWMEEMDCVMTNHAIVNAVLNQKYKQAKAKGIPIVFVINDMSKLKMNEEDIVTLLANLLNNAIEAVERVSEGDKIIKFKMIHEKDRLTICIRNPCIAPLQRRAGKIITTKKEKEEHGIGLAHIESVTEKYKGKNIYNLNEGYFTSTVVIDNI